VRDSTGQVGQLVDVGRTRFRAPARRPASRP